MRNHRGAIISMVLLATVAGCAEPLTSGAAAPARSGRTDTVFPVGHDALAAALGIPVLRTERLARGERELRLWPSSGPGAPSVFVRVVDRRGAVSAELFAYWRVRPDDETPAQRAEFETFVREQWHCGSIRYANSYGFCRLHSAEPARARAVVAYLDSLGAWRAADADPNRGQMVIQIDGRGLGVEIRRGSRYDAQRFLSRNLTPGSVAEGLYRLPSRL